MSNLKLVADEPTPLEKMLLDASAYPSATIVDGWAARNDFYEKQRDVLKRIVRAWVRIDYVLHSPDVRARIWTR